VSSYNFPEAFADIIKPIVKPIVEEAILQALNTNSRDVQLGESADKAFLTIKQAALYSGLGSSTIRLYIRKRQLRALRVGRRVLINRTDLEAFLESNPIPIPDKFLT
jgi:excisionase family DNA binding protein